MMTRLALLDVVARLQLDKKQASALWRLAGFAGGTPCQLAARMRLGLTLVGAGCVGLGLILWVAANWDLLSRPEKFGLLQAIEMIPCVAVAASGRGPSALGLLALIATGGLFAYFGQTYQTGADTWELFAVWAALALPLAFCARTDVVWSAWAVIALTGLTLWSQAHAGFGFRSGGATYGAQMTAVSCAAGLTFLLSKIARNYTGAGEWAFGIAMVLTAILATTTAVFSMEGSSSLHFWFCLILAGVVAALLANGKPFDVFSSSVVALGLNIMLFAGLVKLLVAAGGSNPFGILLMLTVMGALMLAATVKLIVMLARSGAASGERV